MNEQEMITNKKEAFSQLAEKGICIDSVVMDKKHKFNFDKPVFMNDAWTGDTDSETVGRFLEEESQDETIVNRFIHLPFLESRANEKKFVNGVSLKTGLKAIIIGIEEYDIYENKPRDKNLPNAVKDANAMAQFLQKNWGMNKDDIHVLTGRVGCSQAAKILKEVCRSMKENDHLLLYFAGHGDEIRERSYLLMSDSKYYLNDYNRLSLMNAIPLASINNLLKKSKARIKVRIFDACHCGEKFSRAFGDRIKLEEEAKRRQMEEILNAEQDEIEEPAFIKESMEDLLAKESRGKNFMTRSMQNDFMVRENGWITFCSCGIQECSYDLPMLGHGIFTYCLLEGLKGKARRGKGKMYIEDLKIYICGRVPKLMGDEQHPQYQCELTGNIFVE